MQAYAVCIRVKLECRRMESEMVGDGQGHVDEADEVYHDTNHHGALQYYLSRKKTEASTYASISAL